MNSFSELSGPEGSHTISALMFFVPLVEGYRSFEGQALVLVSYFDLSLSLSFSLSVFLCMSVFICTIHLLSVVVTLSYAAM